MDANVRREGSRLGGFLLAAALTLLLVLWFGSACWGGRWVASAPTSSDQYMLATIWELSAEQAMDGHLPLWFPEFAGGGYPVHAAWMYGILYAPTLLFAALPPEAAWTWLAIGHLVLGAAGMFRFLRAEGRSDAAAAAGAVVFALSHFALARIQAGHLNLVMPFAWLPWVLLAAKRAAAGTPGAVGWLALALAAGLLAGHVQVWFFAAPVVAAYAGCEARRAGTLRSGRRAVVAGVALALALTAIQWVPAWELFSVSGHPPESRDVVLGCSAPLEALAAQVAPRLLPVDEPFAHEFSGLGGPLAVAAALLAFRLRDRARWLWFGVLALGLVLAMGLRNPVSEVANDLPPFRFARAPGRALLLVVLAGAVLAAHAVDDLVTARSRLRWLAPAAFAASALGLGVPVFRTVDAAYHDFDWTQTLPAEARGHKVHVLGGRYPYLERFGVPTLRDVCPLDTPGYKALSKEPSPAIAWWFDVGAEVGIPPHADAPDLAATRALADRSRVGTLAACGPYAAFERVETNLPEDEVLRRLRAGERALFLDGARSVGARPSAPPTRVVPLRSDSPSEVAFETAGTGGWLFVPVKWYPGWMQYDDSTGWFPVERANLAFLSADEGYGRVLLQYRPAWLTITSALSVVGLVAAVWIVVRGARRR